MSQDFELATQLVDGHVDESTPQDDIAVSTCSQQSLPPTEGASPIDPAASFRSDVNENPGDSAIIRSSLTPPPSSQAPPNGAGASHALYGPSQPSGIFSPPTTVFNKAAKRDSPTPDYVPPTPQQVVEASPEMLRSLLQSCISEHSKLKMETAHHKLQYNMLRIQAEEDAKRALVEHDMTRREVEVLRTTEHSRQARHDLSTATESVQAKYAQLKMWFEQVVEENESLNKRMKTAKKLIQQKEEENGILTDEREMLLLRIRENREHLNKLCSPGGMYHAAKAQNASPVQQRSTPRQTPKQSSADHRSDRDHGEPRTDRDDRRDHIEMLLHALSQDNNSAPTTPTSARPSAKHPFKHNRNTQSMSSLPTTPTSRRHAGLLPSVDLVPQSEPQFGYSTSRYGTPRSRRKSRESTISADDNEELARQALVAAQSVAAAASFTSVNRGKQSRADEDHEQTFESQASQAASEMLRRDPRESFDVASSVGSRDATPNPGDKTAKRLHGAKPSSSSVLPRMTSEKRKLGVAGQGEGVGNSDLLASPTKRLRAVGGLRDPSSARVGLGIQYGQEA